MYAYPMRHTHKWLLFIGSCPPPDSSRRRSSFYLHPSLATDHEGLQGRPGSLSPLNEVMLFPSILSLTYT